MPTEIIDLANFCGCGGCQGALTTAQRAEWERLRGERLAEEEREGARARERRRIEREEEQRRLEQPFTCAECDGEDIVRNSLTVGTSGDIVCTSCARPCSACSSPVLRDEMNTISRSWGATQYLCDSCTYECYECGDQNARNDMYSIGGDYYCAGCSNNCEYCGDRYVSECENEDCTQRVRGLSSYGKTHANRWLGGPVRRSAVEKDKGYYLGFELEITANTGNVQPVYDWAEAHLGYVDAVDCKEDSSVEGFEIATQPMTPAFFESVNWESFFDMLNEEFPMSSRSRGVEPVDHGLHVHIGRVAFDKDDIAMAAFCYLIGQGDHLVRVARREPTTYCKKVDKPVSSAIKSEYQRMGTHRMQANKPVTRGLYLGRDAINLSNSSTIEIRAFRSTRKADDLRDAMRLVYVAAEYIRSLRAGKGSVSPKALHWTSFAAWVGVNHPDAFASIAGITDKKVVKG